MASKLEGAERDKALEAIAGWNLVTGRDAITKRYEFANFNEAFAFMTRVAMFAEKIDHHPEWFNVYKTVEVTLATHDVDGLSELDIRMAKFMDKLAG